MKILIKQFLGKNHSWACFGWGIAKGFLEQNHDVHMFSTDGIKNFPSSLKSNLIGYVEEDLPNKIYGKLQDQVYDCQVSYTAMRNFPSYLSSGTKNRFGVWCYEWAGKNVLPVGFAKYYKSCDFVCPPSQFAKQVFMDSGIPETAIKVIPHGIISNDFKQTTTIDLKTNKKFKILANIAQNHLRKNIPGLLNAYGKAFTNKDDVCLIIKGSLKSNKNPFDESLKDCLKVFYEKYNNHAEVKVFTEFVDDISSIYRSVDAVFSLTFAEGFFFPGLEAIAAGKLVIAPNWGGHLDFLDTTNSLLINGKETRANPNSMYWESKPNAVWFESNMDDAVDKLRYAYNNFVEMNEKIELQRINVYQEYDWSNIAKQFLDLCR
jgi:glycosyltransferase involved in cell wall biosynthesis